VGREIRLLRRRLAAELVSAKDKHINTNPLIPAIQSRTSHSQTSPNNMPIIRDFALPKAVSQLAFPASTDAFFIAFLASKDPQTNKPWCPDVVAALPTLESTFTGANKPQAAFIEVGQRPEYD
jgi:hypothetical protein